MSTTARDSRTSSGSSPYRTSDHRIEGVALTFQDVTARTSAEEESRRVEERLRLLIGGAVDYAIFTMNEEGRVDFWNPGAERVFGAARLPADAETTVYRVTQEALTNVVKHAHATRVDVVLEWQPEGLTLIIEDDGVGFDPAAPDKAVTGIGLVGMHERAALIGATLELESAPGKGTTIYLRAPLAGAAPRG